MENEVKKLTLAQSQEPLEYELTAEQLEQIAGGYPDGDFPDGVNLCPRCGDSNPTLEIERTVETFGSSVIDSHVPDKLLKVYHCSICDCRFLRFGPFYEFCR